jgi:hypothetical protein
MPLHDPISGRSTHFAPSPPVSKNWPYYQYPIIAYVFQVRSSYYSTASNQNVVSAWFLPSVLCVSPSLPSWLNRTNRALIWSPCYVIFSIPLLFHLSFIPVLSGTLFPGSLWSYLPPQKRTDQENPDFETLRGSSDSEVSNYGQKDRWSISDRDRNFFFLWMEHSREEIQLTVLSATLTLGL